MEGMAERVSLAVKPTSLSKDILRINEYSLKTQGFRFSSTQNYNRKY